MGAQNRVLVRSTKRTKRYRLIKRGLRSGTFYAFDKQTKKRESLATKDQAEAERIINAKNEALVQPFINLHFAKAYLAGVDAKMLTRTWEEVFDAIIELKQGSAQVRWKVAKKTKTFTSILKTPLIQTKADDFLAVLKANKVSTMLHLRKLQDFALDMDRLPKSVIPKRKWPQAIYGEKRSITSEEPEKILANERNPEWRGFYYLLWHVGGSQSDIACLKAEDVNWDEKLIGFFRMKTGSVVHFHFGKEVESLLSDLPSEGFLFPNLSQLHEKDRAKQFRRRCRLAKVSGVSLHSYRYAWAERARTAGYPERFAQEALGHNSKAIHGAYAKKAQVRLPSLEEYEKAKVRPS